MPASVSQTRKFCKNYSVTSFVCIYMGLSRRPQRKKSSGPGLRIRVHIRPHPRTLFKNRTITTNSFEMFIWRTTYIFANIWASIGWIFLQLHTLHFRRMPYVRYQFGCDLSFMESTLPFRLYLCFPSCIFLKSIPRTFPVCARYGVILVSIGL